MVHRLRGVLWIAADWLAVILLLAPAAAACRLGDEAFRLASRLSCYLAARWRAEARAVENLDALGRRSPEGRALTTARFEASRRSLSDPAGFDPPLDSGIKKVVEALVAAGVETFESCEGGAGHAYPEPTVRFHGGAGAGSRALRVALQHGFAVRALNRSWLLEEGRITGPYWELVLWPLPAAQAAV